LGYLGLEKFIYSGARTSELNSEIRMIFIIVEGCLITDYNKFGHNDLNVTAKQQL